MLISRLQHQTEAILLFPCIQALRCPKALPGTVVIPNLASSPSSRVHRNCRLHQLRFNHLSRDFTPPFHSSSKLPPFIVRPPVARSDIIGRRNSTMKYYSSTETFLRDRKEEFFFQLGKVYEATDR